MAVTTLSYSGGTIAFTMNWPGENLIIKLWESLTEKGVGSLLKPWQMRREGYAQGIAYLLLTGFRQPLRQIGAG